METYQDRWIECTPDEIRVRGYYFPWGAKHIAYGRIQGLQRVAMSATRGKGRIWGTANPRYWASLDPRRPTKDVAFVLDLGRMVHPFLTPDDPGTFEAAVRAHVQLPPAPDRAEEPRRGPIV